ncbi:sulfide/dihydroorotate dehydrogenase-like FAD/NAD-binding protein [Chitinispirillales bacterium ANBcel5]|uniref:sulfide/dihydroorotate dehydrogenase-like FAD/NAD-binding protein n=1 Tax=Cellulosispirillum alkaliphilum TaxID=3039283 RepID=UPI002A53B4A6|nr:sulfide/dihydroorotate dehydrogenase-like FAD/NAD-binding protein [Chitinispirillales bacterium ANBcel5]
MTKILKKEQLSDSVWRFRLQAPRIAKKRKAGQFIILRPSGDSERIPLTIANADPAAGWIEIIFQAVGKTTMILRDLKEGDSVLDLAGPLGKPTHIENFGKVLCIGGGVGVAPLYPIISALYEAGNEVTSVLGARTKDLLILDTEISEKSSRTLIATDDGSAGKKGFVSDVFNELISNGEIFDAAFVIGPVMMMKVTTSLTVKAGIKTYVSLNPIMIDGTGMCGGCRITVNDKTKFACIDGPEFDASGIDWDEMVKRLGSYRDFESDARDQHTCRLEGK